MKWLEVYAYICRRGCVPLKEIIEVFGVRDPAERKRLVNALNKMVYKGRLVRKERGVYCCPEASKT